MAYQLSDNNPTDTSSPRVPPEREEDLTELDFHPEREGNGTADGESTPRKWKGKQREIEPVDENTEEGESDSELDVQDRSAVAGYPPTQDTAVEARRVQENLRRWEFAERERRRLARESVNDSAPTSVLGAVGRRASLLLGRKSTANSHRTPRPRESDYPVRLSSIDGSPGSSQHASPTPSPSTSPRASGSLDRNRNPFESDDLRTPTTSDPLAGSPFADPHSNPQLSTLMEGSSNPPTPGDGIARKGNTTIHDRPIIEASPSFLKPPPPGPLGLPPPKTPPPRFKEPDDTPPPTPQATLARQRVKDEPHEEGRWWTDWLCGCRESDDTSDQAGRTNPFE